MLTQRLFTWTSVPVALIVCLRPMSRRGYGVALWIHVCLCLIAWGVYAFMRYTYSFNKADPGGDATTQRCVEYDHRGCRVIEYTPPSRPRRRILAFPGLMISVRRMLREPCIVPFLDDSIVVCYQTRGFGDSDLFVDLSTQTMAEDSLSQYLNFELRTESLPTFFVGYSLGSFLALQLLSNERFGGDCRLAVLVNGFFDCTHIYQTFRLMTSLMGISNADLVGRSRVPILAVHSRGDVTVQPSESARLVRACRRLTPPRPVDRLLVEGDHAHYHFGDAEGLRYRRALDV